MGLRPIIQDFLTPEVLVQGRPLVTVVRPRMQPTKTLIGQDRHAGCGCTTEALARARQKSA